MALPWMPSFAWAHGIRETSPREKRLLWCYVPNGIHMPDWSPGELGPLPQKLPWILSPLENHRARISLLSGLTCDKARANGDGPGDHARSTASFLTGVQARKDEGKIHLAISADQIAANAFAGQTRFSSLAFGTEGGGTAGQCDSGYACGYSNNISWASETSPTGKEINPQQIFDRLFRSGRRAGAAAELRRKQRISIMDFVLEDSKDLCRMLSAEDQAKLDEFQTGVRDLEQRILNSASHDVPEISDQQRPVRVPADRGEHIRSLADLTALAFQTNATRVVTLMFANEGSNRSHPECGVSGGHHQLSHHKNNPENIESIRTLNHFHVQQLAYLLDLFGSISEGEGSLLDSVQIQYGSAIRDGNRHDHHDLPILMVADGIEGTTPGEHTAHPVETPLANLHRSMLDSAGVACPLFGDATDFLGTSQ